MIQEIRNGNLLTIKLNRPEVRNAFNPEMIAKLTAAFKRTQKDKNLRAVIIEGEGSVFCAGADLNWMQSLVKYNLAKNKKDAGHLRGLFASVSDCPVPVVCKVQGAAFGGALGLMAAADYVVCDDKAQISFSEVKLGIAPAVISEFVLKKCNISFAGHWMMSGGMMSAQDALQMGLVHKVVSVDQISEAADKYTQNILDAGPEAVRATKKLLRSKITPALTTTLIAKLRVSSEGQEGLKSFLEKRKPSWKST